MTGTLFVVGTPIGNLEDLSVRAKKTLESCDLILCEDTRVTKKLLDRFGISKPLLSYHQHSTLERFDRITSLLKDGKNLALVSDAGTPGISDPGNKLVEQLVEMFGQEIRITPVPGPTAAAAALSVCGFGTDRFVFLGFPPAKRKRKIFFENLLSFEYPAAIYESPHRIIKTLREIDASGLDKERRIVVCREITKTFETIHRGTVAQVIAQLERGVIKGEFVAVVEGSGKHKKIK
jgi:16S rRNA (cytidine1402-2'-O)-methyltransferase